MFKDLHFLHPQYLSALWLIVPAALCLLYLSFVLRRKARRSFGEEELLARTSRPLKLAGEAALATLWVALLTLLVIAASGPVTRSLPTSIKAGSLQVICIMDVSKSMAAEDYRAIMPMKDGKPPELVPGPYGTRLDYAKYIVQSQLMPSLTGNQLGIVTYSGAGWEQVPLTDEWRSTKWVMDNFIFIGNAPGGGSHFDEGLMKALEMFDRDKISGREQVIVLFTDGGFSGDKEILSKALAAVKQKGIRMIIVGLGSPTPTPIPVYNPQGQAVDLFKLDGQVAMTSRDDAGLADLQLQSGAELIKLEPTGGNTLHISWAATLGGSKAESQDNPVFQYPLALALILLTALFMRGILPRRHLTF